MKGFNYIIISPVKDEQSYVRATIESVIKQSVQPILWIMADDGSTDETPQIVSEYCYKYPWIQLLRLNRGGKRQFPAEIRAFNEGYQLVKNEIFDFIVKLDCDLAFEPGYFEGLLNRFKEDKFLGIASGVYLERKGEDWVPIGMPDYHTAGASKVVRRECFRDIEGFLPVRGWDTIDEIRAQMRGWRTRHFTDLEIRHLKKEGSGIGYLSVNAMHGEIYYLVGGGNFFFGLKVAHRILKGRPFILGGMMMFYGYLRAYLLRKKRAVSDEEAHYYKSLLNQRIKKRLRSLLAFRH